MPGVVQGQVINASSGATIPQDLQVKLQGLNLDAAGKLEIFFERSITVGAGGRFRFDEVPMNRAEAIYIVSAIYDGVEFSQGDIAGGEVLSLDLKLPIYEHTNDPAVISINVLNLIISQHLDGLLIEQAYIFSNLSDRVYVSDQMVSGGRRGSVAISLPPDAYGVTFEQNLLGGRFIAQDDRIVDTSLTPPGRASNAIGLTYFLPLDQVREIAIPLHYQTLQINLLLEGNHRLTSQQVKRAGSQTLDGQAYDLYIGQNLPAGESLTFEVRQPFLSRSTLQAALSVALLLLLLVGGLYWWLSGRQANAGGKRKPLVEQKALIVEIAALDDAFEAGKLNRFEYEARRAELKAQVLEADRRGKQP